MLAFLDRILDRILPLSCVSCGKSRGGEGQYLCGMCQDHIPVIFSPYCIRCGFPPSVDYDLPDSGFTCGICRKRPYRFELARSLGPYQSVLRDLILHFKYRKQPRVIKEITPVLERFLMLTPADYEGWQVVSVPLHLKKLKERGFDQSYLLAKEVARLLKLSGPKQCLRRVRETPTQVNMSRAKRMRNIRGAFELIHPDKVAGQNILLVDDVMTTGATFNEAARVLKKAGAGKVHVFSLARTL